MKIVFITGIDTGVGKTMATGLLARAWQRAGRKVLTAKLVQTGGRGVSEDILQHRKCMGLLPQPADERGATCPYVFPFPASPHCAAAMAQVRVEPEKLDRSWAALERECDLLLLEGVGGVAVPLTSEYTTLDYVAQRAFPCVVVTSPKLGSINHTLLTVEALRQRQVPIAGLVYNLAAEAPEEIAASTRDFLRARYAGIPWLELPVWNLAEPAPELDVSGLDI
jgi:dethiobiotin synthetase